MLVVRRLARAVTDHDLISGIGFRTLALPTQVSIIDDIFRVTGQPSHVHIVIIQTNRSIAGDALRCLQVEGERLVSLPLRKFKLDVCTSVPVAVVNIRPRTGTRHIQKNPALNLLATAIAHVVI